MITPADALAFGAIMIYAGAPVALGAAMAKLAGHAQRNPRALIDARSVAISQEIDSIALAVVEIGSSEPATPEAPMPIDAVYADVILPEQEAKHSEWIAKARETAIAIARQKGCVSSDDLWEACPPPVNADPRVMAAAFHPRSTWELAGYVKSRRKVNHGRTVAEWRLRHAA